MNADGSDLVQLTDNASEDSNPAWSPDGSHLAFVRNAHIFTMRADGAHVVPLTPSTLLAFDPAWSPGGRRIAFVGRDPAASEEDLFTIRLDGSGLRRLRSTGRTESSPSWSLDGRRIVYVMTRYHYESDEQDNWIFTTRPDGTHRRRLTVDPTTLDANPDWRSAA
jgi:TolB protein